MESEITYLLAQGELGGFELVLKEPLVIAKPVVAAKPAIAAKPIAPIKPLIQDKPVALQQNAPQPDLPLHLPKNQNTQNDLLWKDSANIEDFYKALQQHSIYTKSLRHLSFSIPKETKNNASYLLLFHSPLELTLEAREVLENLLKKLNVNLGSCAISFFSKCNDAIMQREKIILKEMLRKEIELINPEKIIFFREAPKPEKIEIPAKINGTPVTFAGKPSITLYSLLEMLPSKPESGAKKLETWNVHLQNCGWFTSLANDSCLSVRNVKD